VLVRPAGDNVVLCPPYIVEETQIGTMVGVLADAIRCNA
jgi:beta-alanine--pyruvate transaminase